MPRSYACIDLKSFYASVECVERGLDPLAANLVVADLSRTEKTICLAVSPALKSHGVPGRPRLFEVVQRVREVNRERQRHAPGRVFSGSSSDARELQAQPQLELSYIVAPPRMSLYMEYSSRIYQIYLSYLAPEDIHVYSIDEVFLDLTDYLKIYGLSPQELVRKMIHEVFAATGITATAGLGDNLYLAKVAMDIVAKHAEADANGVRMAYLDEMSYRRQLWDHRPLTDFWRVGRGYAAKLESLGLFSMGDVARCSLYQEDKLYKLFGINAELLIDHAWGWEPCTMAAIKAYQPSTNSISSGQVLSAPYSCDQARLVLREMIEQLALDLVAKDLVTDQLVLHVGYDIENLSDAAASRQYQGEVVRDFYGRQVPKPAHGSSKLTQPTSSSRLLQQAAMELYQRIIDPTLLVRRLNLAANRVISAATAPPPGQPEQLELFRDYAAEQRQREEEAAALAREKRMQQAVLSIKHKFGKNAIVKAADLQEGATTIERNQQIGGHKA